MHQQPRPAQAAGYATAQPLAQPQEHRAAPAQPAARLAHLTDSTFASLPISDPSKRAILEVLGFQFMTEVQAATLPVVLRGEDVLAKAKTGTGKTIAFLLPAVEALHRSPPKGKDISVLVLSPTRELASQIAKEAESLLTFHPFKSQVVYGGTNINAERSRMNNGRCDVLVATPGRLIDHLENSQGLSQRLQGIKALILDEADQLLEMGFRPAIEKILKFLPRDRQTLLFSATMPGSVHQVAGLALRPKYAFVDTVPAEDAATNVQVHQSWVEVPFDQTLLAVRTILRAATAVPGHKVIVFCTTARFTQYMAALMEAAGLPTLEIHSRKSQAAREKASAAFRAAPQAVLLTSDVSARGVDYPDVTLVLQLGQPSSREQYIHRLGRTARAGKAGQGVLLLAPFETQFVARELKGERALPPLRRRRSLASISEEEFPPLPPPPPHRNLPAPPRRDPHLPGLPAARHPRGRGRHPGRPGPRRRQAPGDGLPGVAGLLQLHLAPLPRQGRPRGAGQPVLGHHGPGAAARPGQEDHRHDGPQGRAGPAHRRHPRRGRRRRRRPRRRRQEWRRRRRRGAPRQRGRPGRARGRRTRGRRWRSWRRRWRGRPRRRRRRGRWSRWPPVVSMGFFQGTKRTHA
jgi:ATP-dependent RNA helicase MSS116